MRTAPPAPPTPRTNPNKRKQPRPAPARNLPPLHPQPPTPTPKSQLPNPDSDIPRPTPPRRARSLQELRHTTAAIRAAAATDPRLFRNHLRLDPASNLPFAKLTLPWQEADFAALDPAWLQAAGLDPPIRHSDFVIRHSPPLDAHPPRRAYIERPRGHAKTADMAIQIAWALLFAARALRGIAAAADREQAGLIAQAVRSLTRANPGLCGGLRFRQNAVENPATGARLDLISSDVPSSFGITPDFVICDELAHWPKEDLWHSLASAAAKKPHCVLVVLTNAGAGRGWQWQVREAARTRDDWYFSTLDGPQAPWIGAADLAEQRAILPPAVYDRLWNNRWQDAAGDFLTTAEVAACRDGSLLPNNRGRLGTRYVAAIDYAEKHDLTAAVLLHQEGDRLIVDRLDVAVPKPDAPVLVAWVEDWIARTARAFPHTTFVLDEYQLLSTVQRLSPRLHVVRFPFAAGKGNHDLALTLRRLIVHRQLAWYPGCGARPDDPADDLESELASLLLTQSHSGRLRFTAPPAGHDDRAFTLAAASWHALSTTPAPTLWHVTPPHEGGLLTW